MSQAKNTILLMLLIVSSGGAVVGATREPAAPAGSKQTSGAAQESGRNAQPGMSLSVNSSSKPVATPLAQLLEEAERHNPRILAARRAWQAAEQVPSQVSTLPDPQVVVQQLNVGSPRPFAGFTNNNFAYLGLGVSQDLPYPGKLRLKGEMAKRDAAVSRDGAVSTSRAVVEQLREVYFNLGYNEQILAILHRDQELLANVEKVAEARYRVGEGNEQDVLKAQLEQSKLLEELALRRQQIGALEASLKLLLNRPMDSPDITAEAPVETLLPYTADELMASMRGSNPAVDAGQQIVRREGLQVELAHKDFYPDFNVQYMVQRTGLQFPAYYMLTFGVKIPIYRRRKQGPELAESVENMNRSRRLYEAQLQSAYFQVRDQYLAAETGAQVLKIYRQGLLPQAAATFQAGLAAYSANREDFETLLSSFLDVLHLDEEYWRALAKHEIALAKIEQITGMSLQSR